MPTVETSYGSITLQEDTGFVAIQEQISRHAAHKGFILNLLVVGRRGLGASTLVNSLFSVPLVAKDRPNELTTSINEIAEDGIVLRVAVTTYHGEDYNAVLKFIEQQNEEYYEKEQGLFGKIDDRRLHACLYLLPGNRIHANEMRAMRAISKVCNMLPVITKADMYTEEELAGRRACIDRMLVENEISLFCYKNAIESDGCVAEVPGVVDAQHEVLCSDCAADEAAQAAPEGREILATIASESTYDLQGRVVRGRKYPWGFVDVANESHSDFKKLQRILVQTHYMGLLWKTDTVFYNAFRKKMSSKEKACSESMPDILMRRLSRLQTQLGDALEEKHHAAVEELLREENELVRGGTERLQRSPAKTVSFRDQHSYEKD